MSASVRLAWDYSALADSYDARPSYNAGLLREIFGGMRLPQEHLVLDIGAGTGKLTVALCEFGFNVIALEPNEQMRRHGLAKSELRDVEWVAGRGESLPFVDRSIDLVTYGSSFAVLDAKPALDECARVLRPGGHWLAMWNHRDLEDPLQRGVEAIIHRYIPGYDYGRRRESPVPDVVAHGEFRHVVAHERSFVVEIAAAVWMHAWRAHATLLRQAGEQLADILSDIESLIGPSSTLRVPYVTRAWTARRR